MKPGRVHIILIGEYSKSATFFMHNGLIYSNNRENKKIAPYY